MLLYRLDYTRAKYILRFGSMDRLSPSPARGVAGGYYDGGTYDGVSARPQARSGGFGAGASSSCRPSSATTTLTTTTTVVQVASPPPPPRSCSAASTAAPGPAPTPDPHHGMKRLLLTSARDYACHGKSKSQSVPKRVRRPARRMSPWVRSRRTSEWNWCGNCIMCPLLTPCPLLSPLEYAWSSR